MVTLGQKKGGVSFYMTTWLSFIVAAMTVLSGSVMSGYYGSRGGTNITRTPHSVNAVYIDCLSCL